MPRPDLPPYKAVVREVDRLSTKDQSVFVWGSYSEITWASERPMATRFPHTNFVTGVDQGQPTKGAMGDLCTDLDRTPAHASSSTPARPTCATPARCRSSACRAMANLMTSYEPVDDINGVIIYRLARPWVGC